MAGEVARGRLTTHVLDTARGCPAPGVRIALFRLDEHGTRRLLKTVRTNADGRTGDALLDGPELEVGVYELVFQIGEYFRMSAGTAEPPFLDQVPVRFGIADPAGHYHIPLLASPWSYSTYRGS
ncbi:MAG: hydroxyisourate hydrolase [Herpetosiphon sp.]